MKYAHIDAFNKTYNLAKEIKDNIDQIEKFLSGSRCIEYYSNWMNYMYFLVITQRTKELEVFYRKANELIDDMKMSFEPKVINNKSSIIGEKTKEFLHKHLTICLNTVLSIDYPKANKFSNSKKEVLKYVNANMFNHSLVALPLANYLKYDKEISYIRMSINDIGEIGELNKNKKFVWSPRFIHYDELLLLLFYCNHANKKESMKYNYEDASIVDKFVKVNHLYYGSNKPFEILCDRKEIDIFNNSAAKYILKKIDAPSEPMFYPNKISVAIANLKLSEEKLKYNGNNRWSNISFKDKGKLHKILMETYEFNKTIKHYFPKLLVLPELSIPLYWIDDLIKFSKRTQIAVVGGIQYVYDEERAYNYLLTILPFETGACKYKNAFVYIREKNDYSPIEKKELAKSAKTCVDAEESLYQIYSWKGMDLSTFLCYEFTDIVARAILKGRCDIIAAPEFNKDTTYFSNIIDTVVRDLHVFVVQSNTSQFGDSRITGPYDRDNKDLFKIKGGENDSIITGIIDFEQYVKYQENYYPKLKTEVEIAIENNKKAIIDKIENKVAEKPSIKPLSARYFNHRTKNR